ncbi:hypothetical protein N4G62_17450 [Sphingomonas sanguinis]|uniref:Uncharacterized protein n=1 Tax=Sphingomonas sanguinis TaxID=33051 RepID=A0ABU5LV61_9SPHN|nr:hypothetical protein [Sphingomonas sanguinis]
MQSLLSGGRGKRLTGRESFASREPRAMSGRVGRKKWTLLV